FPALMAIGELRSEITPLLHVSEVRAVAEDDLWMSPCWGQTCLAIHFTWKSKWTQVKALLPKIEAALDPFNPVPHWGKLYTMSP
ncbi:D-arabinono-1,4-lactone oxidase, partial [Acinetobacter baumannii]